LRKFWKDLESLFKIGSKIETLLICERYILINNQARMKGTLKEIVNVF